MLVLNRILLGGKPVQEGPWDAKTLQMRGQKIENENRLELIDKTHEIIDVPIISPNRISKGKNYFSFFYNYFKNI